MPRGKSVIAPPKAKVSAETAFEMFIKDCRTRNLRPATIETYKVFVKSYIDFIGAETDISIITKDNIQDWILSEQQTKIKDVTVVAKVRHVRAWVYFLMAGGGIFQLQRILGHADISTTRHYVQLYSSDLKKDYDELCPLDNLLK